MSRTQNPIDLTVADLMARGSSQKRWLQQMLSPTGLDPTDGKYGPYSRALWRRIEAAAGTRGWSLAAVHPRPARTGECLSCARRRNTEASKGRAGASAGKGLDTG